MDFDHLVTFLEIAKQGSFSRAGQKLYRSQPAVSAQIRQLEQEYGQKLFDRVGKSVRLTVAGETLLEYAGRLLTLRNESLRAVADQAATPRGSLAIGANEATCLYVLPNIFSEYQRRFPAVQISIYRNFSHKIMQKVQEGAVELGIVTLPLTATNVEVISLFRDEMQVVAPASHPLAKNRSVTLEEVANYPLILPKTGHTRVVLDRLLREYRDHIQVSMELASVETIKKFVGAGLGISLISRTYVQPEVAAGLLKLIPLDGQKLYRELGLIYRRDRYLSLPAKVFIEVARETTKANSGSNSTTKTQSIR